MKPASKLRHLITAVAVVATSLVAPLVLVPAAAHAATAERRDPCGGVDSYFSWSSVSKPWKVTHATRYEHYTHTSGEYTRTVAEQAQLTSGVDFDVKGSAGANFVIFHLGGEAGLKLKNDKLKTVGTSITDKETMNTYDAYIFYRGDHSAKGNFIYYTCGGDGHHFVVNSTGTAHSWDVYADGALACKTSPPSGSLGVVVKREYC